MMLEQNDEWRMTRPYVQVEGLQALSDTAPTRRFGECTLLTQPGDRVAVASPGSMRVPEVVATLALEAIELPLPGEGDDDWRACSAALLTEQRPTACVVDLSLLAAAVGISDADKQDLGGLLAAHQVAIIAF